MLRGDDLLEGVLCPFFTQSGTAAAQAEQIERVLACLSPAEERQLSRLLHKLELHLQELLGGHRDRVDADESNAVRERVRPEDLP
jgi:hypothetical protein